MGRGDYLTILTRTGLALMAVSNILTLTLGMNEAEWKYSVYLVLGNYAQGMIYPSILFNFIRTAVKSGKRTSVAPREVLLPPVVARLT